MPNHETPRTDNDHLHLVHRPNDDPSLGHILRPGCHLWRRAGRPIVHRSVAGLHERSSLLPDRQPGLLLYPTDDPHYTMLRFDLDQSMEKKYTDRHQGRTDGENAAEIEGQGGKDVGGGSNTVRIVMAAIIRDLRED